MTIRIKVGTVVTVVNHDGVTHTWTAIDGTFDSGPIKPGASYSFTFTKAGTYRYHCTIHTFMKGTIIVTG
ncbi:MAG: plastocyanin/azurin family copper-binding protein [Acidimicrobiales bacterium]